VRIEVERETRLRVTLHHRGSIAVFGSVLVSPALPHRLAASKADKPIAFPSSRRAAIMD